MERMYSAPVNLPLTPLPQDVPPSPIPITVHGAGLPPIAVETILAREQETRWLPFLFETLLSLFAFAAAGLASAYVGAVEGSFLMALLPVVLGLLVFGNRSRKRAAARRRMWDARLYMSSVAGGVTTTVHPDRIEQHTARVHHTMYFTDTTVLWEHSDWLLLQTDGAWVALAATDVTPWEAQSIYELLAAAIPPARQFTRGQFCARRIESAPPPFSTTPPVCYERVEYQEEKAGFAWPAGALSWLFAAALSVGSMFTTLFAITPSFFLDYLILFSACFAGGVVILLAAMVSQPHGTSTEVALSFTSEGLLVERDGKQQFVAATDVRARRTENGMKLITPAGMFTVPWALTKNRQQLEWMLFSR